MNYRSNLLSWNLSNPLSNHPKITSRDFVRCQIFPSPWWHLSHHRGTPPEDEIPMPSTAFSTAEGEIVPLEPAAVQGPSGWTTRVKGERKHGYINNQWMRFGFDEWWMIHDRLAGILNIYDVIRCSFGVGSYWDALLEIWCGLVYGLFVRLWLYASPSCWLGSTSKCCDVICRAFSPSLFERIEKDGTHMTDGWRGRENSAKIGTRQGSPAFWIQS